MNEQMKLICVNMRLALSGYETQMQLAAQNDDGKIDRTEARALHELLKSEAKFKKILEKYI